MYTYKVKVGKGQLEIQEPDFKKMWEHASFVGDFPSVCGKCKSDDIAPMQKSPKGNDYWGLKCKSCGAELTFHQKKEGGFYIRYDDEWKKFGEGSGGDSSGDSSDDAAKNVASAFQSDSSIPF